MNANKIVMLSQTHGYNQFVRFPKLKVIILPVHFNDLKTVTGSRPTYKRLISVMSEPSVKSLNFNCDLRLRAVPLFSYSPKTKGLLVVYCDL